MKQSKLILFGLLYLLAVGIAYMVLFGGFQLRASETRIPYYPDRTYALSPTTDNETVGNWIDSDSDGSYCDEIDDPPLSDGWGDWDTDSYAMAIANLDSRLVCELEDLAALDGDTDAITINWLGIRWVAKRSGLADCYSGFSNIGVHALTPSTDYFLYEDVTDWTNPDSYTLNGSYEPLGWFGTGIGPVFQTNPATGYPWTVKEVNALQLVIEQDIDTDSTDNITHTEATVLVNISNRYPDPPSTSLQTGGGD